MRIVVTVGTSIVSAAFMMGALALPVAAWVGYASTDPEAAAPGQTVLVTPDGDCPNLAEHPRSLRMDLVGSTGVHYPVTLRATSGGRYAFVVPEVPAGSYGFEVECYLDSSSLQPEVPNWVGDTAGFRVLTPAPTTSTGPTEATDGQGPGLLLAGAFLIGFLLVMRRSSGYAH